MTRLVRRHGRMVDAATGRPARAPKELLHPAVQAEIAQEADDFSDHEQLVASLGGGAPAAAAGAAQPSAMDRMRAGEIGYDHGGPGGASRPTPQVGAAQAWLDARAGEKAARGQAVDEAYQYGQQYLNNPLSAKGRARMGRQFWEAPGGGHIRRGLAGQEVLGHTITDEQAHLAEQGLMGLTAVGIGVPAFLAAVQQLSTPQDQNTIPFN